MVKGPEGEYVVIGLGRFGTAVALRLAADGAHVIAVDKDPEMVEAIKEEVAVALTMDATDIKALRSYNIHKATAVVVAIGETFEDLLLCAVNLLELGARRVVARAFNPTQKMILKKLGVHEIVSPEEDVGIQVAERLLHPGIKRFIPLPEGYEIVEVEVPRGLVGLTVSQVGFADRYNVNLVTIKQRDKKNPELEHVMGCPKRTYRFGENDILILMGHTEDLERFMEVFS